METVIHPDINADEKLRPLVERADAALTRALTRHGPDQAVWWKEADEFGQPLIRLEFRYFGESASRRFKPGELEAFQTTGAAFYQLFREVIVRRMNLAFDRTIRNLREWRESVEAEEAREGQRTTIPQEVQGV